MSDAAPTGSGTAQIAKLLTRGPAQALPRTPAQHARRGLRAAVLRLVRPYSVYQHELDAAILASLERLSEQSGNDPRLSQLEERQDRHLHGLESQIDRQQEQIERLEVLMGDVVTAAAGLSAGMQSVRSALSSVQEHTAQWRTAPYLAGDPLEQFTASVGDVTGFRSNRFGADVPSPYVGFEDIFRGPADRVVELQRPYVELARGHQPVLDIGCGRGEFLSLLASEGIAARGVEMDSGMIERCRAEGLSVELADANEYLEELDDGSLGTVFCAQVIEHLPVSRLQRLLELACRKLVPDGLFIAETINPHSIPAFKTFWVDLTHQHPIFPEVALALCGLAGFEAAYVFAPGHDSFEAARFDSNSYAVVATAPSVSQS